jgi:hypothetical protein
MLGRLAVVLVLSAVGGVLPAVAQERRGAPATGQRPDCYCRAEGKFFAEGQTICLRTGGEPGLAECVMETNVMSWRQTRKPCPES